MKRTLTLVLLFLSLGGFAQSSIFAVVDGNNVTLWQTNTERNCGSRHGAAITLENNHINWYQVDTGGVANCFVLLICRLLWVHCLPENIRRMFMVLNG